MEAQLQGSHNKLRLVHGKMYFTECDSILLQQYRCQSGAIGSKYSLASRCCFIFAGVYVIMSNQSSLSGLKLIQSSDSEEKENLSEL